MRRPYAGKPQFLGGIVNFRRLRCDDGVSGNVIVRVTGLFQICDLSASAVAWTLAVAGRLEVRCTSAGFTQGIPLLARINQRRPRPTRSSHLTIVALECFSVML